MDHTNMSNVQMLRNPTDSGFIGNISIKSRVFFGFGLVLLMLVALAGFSAVLIRGIDSNFRLSQSSVNQKSLATDMDLVMQKVRVRVNQWLRSMNPDFARDADLLLKQDVEIVSKGAAQATTDKEKAIVAEIDRALKAYIVSWRVVQDMYAEEAKLYAEKIEAPSAGIRATLAKLRDSAAAQNELDESHLISEARDGFIAAEMLAYGYRTGSIKDAAVQLTSAIAGSLAALEKARRVAAGPADIDAIKGAEASTSAWNDSFIQATKLAAARVARLDSWTRNEGEAMAVGANALRAEAEAAATNAEAKFVAELANSQTTLYIATPLVLLVGLALSLLLSRSITVPLARMTATLKALAAGDRAQQIPDTGRRDEIGDMARAAQIFKDGLLEADHLRDEQVIAEQRAREQRKVDMTKLADDFDGAVGEIIETVSSASTELQASAGRLTKTAERAQEVTTTVAAASEEASTNVQSVASATEEMASSVNEISRQVQASARIANEAVGQARKTNDRIEELSKAAARIGDVVELINTIAGQTNLLALNATIEAARAGEAGRGFAVVASEVKALAEQTAKATGEIGQQISGIQAATQESVNDIKEISGTIEKLSEISSTIASAVEEQGAATQEISRNVQQAAQGTLQVSSNIIDVQRGAGETGLASSQVLSAAQSLSRDSNRLKLAVGKFLSSVRTA
jgi:methyl-accepting chemotaxis protein